MANMPMSVSLCPIHTGHFYVPDEADGAICPQCDQVMDRYVRADSLRGAVSLSDDLIAEIAKRLAASSSLDEATAWNLLYPPNGALAPLVPAANVREETP